MDNCIYGPLMEEWKDVPGFEGWYAVSNYGVVKSFERDVVQRNRTYRAKEKILKHNITSDGYIYFFFYDGKSKKRWKLHRLISIVFIGEPPADKPWVNHKNTIKTDSFVLNLEWCTPRENMTHAYASNCHRKKKTSNYVGVHLSKDKTWRASIGIDGKYYSLGTHETEEEAHKAYRMALTEKGIINRYA